MRIRKTLVLICGLCIYFGLTPVITLSVAEPPAHYQEDKTLNNDSYENSDNAVLGLSLVEKKTGSKKMMVGSHTSSNSSEVLYPFHRLLTTGSIRAYQVLISPSRGTPCPMEPHCSLFGYQVFQAYNPGIAYLMTVDRLHRCSHDLNNYEVIINKDGYARFLDPPQLVSSSSVKNGFLKESELRLETPQSTVSIAQEDERLYSFANVLMAQGDYNRAITEFLRLMYYYPDSSFRCKAAISVFYCYYYSNQFLTAIHWGEKIINQDLIEVAENLQFNLMIAVCYYQLENFPRSREHLAITINNNQGVTREKSLLLQGITFAKEENWEQAGQSFRQIPVDSKFSYKAREFEKLLKEGRDLKLKSLPVAGALSVIPGLGYLYNGYPQTALSSFLVNSMFMWGTYEAFKNNNRGLGYMMGFVSTGWYLGNIYGSVMTAERQNTKMKKDILVQFELGLIF